MKHNRQQAFAVIKGFTRQRWRVRIETVARLPLHWAVLGSPARDGGCGLKQVLCSRIINVEGFTRQRWRVRIETLQSGTRPVHSMGSPARDGGCGLKLKHRVQLSIGCVGSPARDGGCGLKQDGHGHAHTSSERFTRQRWRVRIETATNAACLGSSPGSPARDGGCGLKRPCCCR